MLAPRQLGKSSLIVRTAARLTAEDVRTVIIDLQRIGTHVDAAGWYFGPTWISDSRR